MPLPFRLVRVRGMSMQPTLQDGDLLLMRPGVRRLGRIAVVVLPGDRPIAVKRLTRRMDDSAQERWWVERDNPRAGVDSWLVGPIPAENVLGVVVLRIWPRPRVLRAVAPS